MLRWSLPVFLAVVIAGCRDQTGGRIDYGDGNSIVYQGEATEDDGRRLGKYLQTTGFFKGRQRHSVRLDRKHGVYHVHLLCIREHYEPSQHRNGMLMDGARFSRHAFNGQPVELYLLDHEHLESFEVLPPKDVGCVIRIGMNEVHYNGGTEEAVAKKLADLLIDVGFFKEHADDADLSRPPTGTVQLTRNDDAYELGLIVKDDYKNSSAYPDGYRKIGERVSKELLEGVPVQVKLKDKRHRTRELLTP